MGKTNISKGATESALGTSAPRLQPAASSDTSHAARTSLARAQYELLTNAVATQVTSARSFRVSYFLSAKELVRHRSEVGEEQARFGWAPGTFLCPHENGRSVR